ncbi:aminotransferase, partial [Burkholderia cenocepacia]|nr:aminotransferase [Burkholderia cenocepacia]
MAIARDNGQADRDPRDTSAPGPSAPVPSLVPRTARSTCLNAMAEYFDVDHARAIAA